MIFFVALIPATMLTIAGYVVLYVSHRSEGGFKSFGRYLSFWAFTLAALVVLGSVIAAARADRMHHWCPMMHGGHHMPMPGMGPPMHPPMNSGPEMPSPPPEAAPPK